MLIATGWVFGEEIQSHSRGDSLKSVFIESVKNTLRGILIDRHFDHLHYHPSHSTSYTNSSALLDFVYSNSKCDVDATAPGTSGRKNVLLFIL
jgi:hypothetical protein